MRELFYLGGIEFMSALTVLLVITTAWIIYHFIVAYSSKQTDISVFLRKMGYGKSMGLFALMTGLFGQMLGFSSAFSHLNHLLGTDFVVTHAMVYEGIKVSSFVTIYGSLIYIFSLLLWYVASVLLMKKQTKLVAA